MLRRRALRPFAITCMTLATGWALVLACGDPDTVKSTTGPMDGAVTDTPVDLPDTSIKDTGLGDSNPPADAFIWPDCNSEPASASTKTIPQVWSADPVQPTEVWISGVYVTAISKNACIAGTACFFFLQQDLTYASLAQGAHHGIRVFVSAATSQYFTGLAVGDQVDALGWAWRYTYGGQHELLVQVDKILPGCAKKTGTGNATPITALLSDFSVSAYEDTMGPLLVQVDNVTGTPQQPGQTFGLGNSMFPEGGFPDAGTDIVSASPYCLQNGVFTGLTPGMKTKFKSVTGVFGIFEPGNDAALPKFLELYPRVMTEMAQ